MLDRYDQDLLLDYLEGELDADRRAQMDALLAEDPQLAGLLNEMAMDRAALRSLPEAQAPADLVHDVTQTLERRMLLDEPVDETGPIPLARGRGLTNQPPRSISWGRVVGLTGLAASVALAAAIVVITLDDPLERTANEFAASTAEDEIEPNTQEADAANDGAIADAAGLDNAAAENIAGTLEAAQARTAPDAALAKAVPERIKPDELANDAIASVQPGSRLFEGAPTADPTPPALGLTRDTPAAPAPRALGSTAAISAIQPRQQLVLLTESPDLSRDQLFEFCVANGIPILQADQPRAQRQARAFAAGQAVEDADTESETASSDYTLLINESQLDTLITRLNNDVTIEPSRAGKASLFSNQAALLTDLAAEPVQDQPADNAGQHAGDLAGDQPKQAAIASEPKAARFGQANQQAVELRLPSDLGSPYANSRNAYNLTLQKQQVGYTQPDQREAVVARPNKPSSAEHQPNAQADLDDAEQDKLKERLVKRQQPDAPVPTPTLKPERDADRSDANPLADREAHADNATKPTPQRQVDPSRGNWLAAHLPVADTTPLLLQWRAEQSVNPTNLVPVTIKRAELKDVNTLRMRQQAELAERVEKPADDAEAIAEQAEEQPEAEADKADKATPPIEVEPADSPEPSE